MSHFYWRATGEPCWQLRGSNGELRSPTMRDAKFGLKGQFGPYELVPPVTMILRSFGVSPAIADWRERIAIECAATNPARDGETADDYAVRLGKDIACQRDAAAELGQRVHAAIEGTLIGRHRVEPTPDIVRIASPALEYIATGIKQALAVERNFAVRQYGGRVDLYALLGDGRRALIDFKTQGTKEKYGHTLRAYDEWGEQLAAYLEGLEQPCDVLINIAVSTTKPGAWLLHEWPDVNKLRKQWACKLRYFQLANNWWPPKGGLHK